MPAVHSGLTFGSFLSAFPLPVFPGLASLVLLGMGKFGRTTRISRTFLIGFWMVCWAADGGIALTTWQMQQRWLHTEAISSGHETVSYYEQNGYTAAQALHYHAVALLGMNSFQRMHNQFLGAMMWYGLLFLLLPAFLFWIDRHRAQTLGAAASA